MEFTIAIPSHKLSIRPLARTESNLNAALAVYQQCEDFLALGPVARASLEMVLADMDLSEKEGCTFCGIFSQTNGMVGIVDFSTGGFEGDPSVALLSLMMIAAHHRGQGLGEAVFRAVMHYIRETGQAKRLAAGVQVNNPAAIRFWQRMGFSVSTAPRQQRDGTTTYDLSMEIAENASESR